MSPEVLPVTIRPSGSSMAAAGAPVSAALARAAGTVLRMLTSRCREFMSISCLRSSSGMAMPFLTAQAEAK